MIIFRSGARVLLEVVSVTAFNSFNSLYTCRLKAIWSIDGLFKIALNCNDDKVSYVQWQRVIFEYKRLQTRKTAERQRWDKRLLIYNLLHLLDRTGVINVI